MTTSEKIIALIQDSIDKFDAAVPAIQKEMFADLVKRLQALDTRGGRILSTVGNLRLIGEIKNSLEKIILNKAYIANVTDYVKAFGEVTNLQVQYFKDFNNDFKPNKTLSIVRELAIDSTINSLTEGGIATGVLSPVTELLQVNATTGGKIADLYDMLRARIVSSPDNIGALQKYTQQITTDSLNQYSAQYHKAVTVDLGFEWHRYTGALRTTSRQFCKLLVEKDYVHDSELPEILKGHINGHKCAIYAKTGLPYGMNPATTVDNLEIYRGGYSCGHSFFGLPTAAVPKAVRGRIVKIAG